MEIFPKFRGQNNFKKNIGNHHLVPSLFSARLFVESKSSSIFFDATPRLHCHQNFLLPKDQQWRSANGLWEKVAPFVTQKPEHFPQFLVSLQRVYTMNSKICSIHVACMYISKKNRNKIQQVLAKTSRLHIEVNKFKTFKGHSNSGFFESMQLAGKIFARIRKTSCRQDVRSWPAPLAATGNLLPDNHG